MRNKLHKTLVLLSLIVAFTLTIAAIRLFKFEFTRDVILQLSILLLIVILNYNKIIKWTKRKPSFKKLKSRLEKHIKSENKNDYSKENKTSALLSAIRVNHKGITFGEANHNLIIFNKLFPLVTKKEENWLFDIWEVYTNRYEEKQQKGKASDYHKLNLGRRIRRQIERDLNEIKEQYSLLN